MDKKTLGIILGVSAVVVAGIVYFVYRGGFLGGGIADDSIMGAMKKSGQTVMSKSEFVSKCKESDKDSQDMCYAMGALYYRDVSFCKYVTSAENKANCTKGNIEKYYETIKAGGSATPFGPGGGIVPFGGETPEGGVVPDNGGGAGMGLTNTPSASTPASSGKMTDEIYIEVLAQASYLAADPSTYAVRMKAVFDKYGITGEDVEAYGASLKEDPQRAAAISQKYMQRAMELRGMGQ